MFPMVSSHHRPHLVAEGPVALCMLGRRTSSGKSIRTLLSNEMECVMRQPTFPLSLPRVSFGLYWSATIKKVSLNLIQALLMSSSSKQHFQGYLGVDSERGQSQLSSSCRYGGLLAMGLV